MKRTILFLLCALLTLSVACIQIIPKDPDPTAEPVAQVTEPVEITPAPTEAVVEVPTETPGEPATEAPSEPTGTENCDKLGLPMEYDVYEEVGWNVSEAEMFRCDLDEDGKEERVSFRLDEENDTTRIMVDELSIELDVSCMLERVILCDLDPTVPGLNLLVVIDEASDDLITTEVHLDNGKLVKGTVIGYGISAGNGKLYLSRGTDLLGTKDGVDTCSGMSLTPDTGWFTCWTPTDDEIIENRDELIEYGVLLHTVREVPCTINGSPAKLAKDVCVYMTGFNEDLLVEVCTLDGKTAQIQFEMTDDGWPYTIDGVSQEEYFDNLFFAD